MESMDKDNSSNGYVSIGRQIRDYAIYIGLSIIIALLLRNYVFARADVEGRSMESTLFEKDVIFVEKLSLLVGKVSRGEVIIFDAKNTNGDIYVKRVIGVEGDEIQIKDGKVFLNGSILEENYLDKNTQTYSGNFLTKDKIYKVEKGKVFVLGDNREHSKDSRDLGPVNIEDIKGHTILRIYPFKKIKLF